MSLYVIGDTHLSLSSSKPMDIFGGWNHYMQRLEENWRRKIQPEDTVVIPGDVSWGMSLAESLPDFVFLDSLPGEKILLKGNHDYWWSTRNKIETFFTEHGLSSLQVVNNSCISTQGVVVCGTRGWLFEQGEAHDKKIVAREAGRLRASLEAAKQYPEQEKIAFLHYPPLYCSESTPEIVQLLLEYGVARCYYGHIHGAGCQFALNGSWKGIEFALVSADFLKFDPQKIK